MSTPGSQGALTSEVVKPVPRLPARRPCAANGAPCGGANLRFVMPPPLRSRASPEASATVAGASEHPRSGASQALKTRSADIAPTKHARSLVSGGHALGRLWDISPSPPQRGVAAPSSPVGQTRKRQGSHGVGRSGTRTQRRPQMEPSPTDGGRAARHHGGMEHDALSKSLFALPQVEADVLRIVAAGYAGSETYRNLI